MVSSLVKLLFIAIMAGQAIALPTSNPGTVEIANPETGNIETDTEPAADLEKRALSSPSCAMTDFWLIWRWRISGFNNPGECDTFLKNLRDTNACATNGRVEYPCSSGGYPQFIDFTTDSHVNTNCMGQALQRSGYNRNLCRSG